MAQVSEITIEDLLKHQRIDAEYFQPHFLKLETSLNQFPTRKIDEIGYVTDGEHGAVSLLNDGVRYLMAENIKEGYITIENVRYVSESVYKRNQRASAKAGDILISIKGTLGIAAVAEKWLEPATLSRDVAIIKLKDADFTPEYVCVFLMSNLGKTSALREGSGGVQQMITLGRLRDLVIPMLDNKIQTKVSDIYYRFLELRQKSKSLYSRAEQLLLQKLGLNDFMPQWVAGYETNLNNVIGVARIDAEYFQPKYEIVKKKIRAIDHDTLGNLVKPLKKGIEVGSEAYANEGVPFLRVSNIEKLRIDNSSEQYIDKELYEELKDKFCPKKGEILLSKDGTPGIAYYLTEDIKTIISGGIVRLKTTKIEPEYLTLVLNSLIVQAQIEQDAGGALIKHWRPDQIKTTLIPILPKPMREKIVEMIQESFLALHESRQLLEQAKREVEEMIEAKT